MEKKKNPNVSLEKKKGMFFQIGLVLTLIAVIIAFEWKSYDRVDYSLGQLNMEDLEEEIIPITKQEEKPPPPPPPPPPIEEENIVDDEEEIENEFEMEDSESDEEEEIIIEEEEEEEFFMVVENMPEFPGGDLGLMKYIQKNVRYPAIAKEYNITGKVYVSFIVDKTGSVTNVKIVRGVDKNLDAEALRVVKSLPKYTPGRQMGRPVRVMFTIPVNFKLN